MYGELSTRYHVASSGRSEYRRSSTFQDVTSDPSTRTETCPRTEKIRSSAFVMAGLQNGAVMTVPALSPTAVGTRSDAEATNPGRSNVTSTSCLGVSPGRRLVPRTRAPSRVSFVELPLLDIAEYPYGASVTASYV